MTDLAEEVTTAPASPLRGRDAQEKLVLIYRAAALVLAASDIDMRGRACGSVRAGHILTKISDRLRDDGVALRKKADAIPASPPEQPAAPNNHAFTLNTPMTRFSNQRPAGEWWKAHKQTEIDKDLVRAYYGDREAFDRVREFIVQKETPK